MFHKGKMIEPTFPPWAIALGITMTVIPIVIIPVVALLQCLGVATWIVPNTPLAIDSSTEATETLVVNCGSKHVETNGKHHEVNGNTRRQSESGETTF